MCLPLVGWNGHHIAYTQPVISDLLDIRVRGWLSIQIQNTMNWYFHGQQPFNALLGSVPTSLAELNLKGFANSTEQWKDLEQLKEVFWFKRTPISGTEEGHLYNEHGYARQNYTLFLNVFHLEYVFEHWKEDDFFGSQFLNGTNPNVIQRCSKLPHNFPVTEEMVQPFLEGGSSLAMEMQVCK